MRNFANSVQVKIAAVMIVVAAVGAAGTGGKIIKG